MIYQSWLKICSDSVLLRCGPLLGHYQQEYAKRIICVDTIINDHNKYFIFFQKCVCSVLLRGWSWYSRQHKTFYNAYYDAGNFFLKLDRIK